MSSEEVKYEQSGTSGAHAQTPQPQETSSIARAIPPSNTSTPVKPTKKSRTGPAANDEVNDEEMQELAETIRTISNQEGADEDSQIPAGQLTPERPKSPASVSPSIDRTQE